MQSLEEVDYFHQNLVSFFIRTKLHHLLDKLEIVIVAAVDRGRCSVDEMCTRSASSKQRIILDVVDQQNRIHEHLIGCCDFEGKTRIQVEQFNEQLIGNLG